MMTPLNGNIFRVTGPLWGEFTGEFPAQRPVTRSFHVFFDLRLDKRLSKQSRRRWFETLSRPLWRHYDVCIFCQSSILRWRRQLKQFLVVDKNTFILHIQNTTAVDALVTQGARTSAVMVLTDKAAGQLNALARISRFLSASSRMIIYNSFINSNVDYCPMLHFCGKKNGDKIGRKSRARSQDDMQKLWWLYPELLREAETYKMPDKRLHSMLLHIFKSLKVVHVKCLNDMFSIKQIN